ncbi:CDP-alcohol phosphatidyltransferase family protein [Kaistia sp. UC242_56]|uniref:CDP-alcohol phosphatidyltransferase family protein n=1 Tax=Kaistia sp. UC242_56 TaxID=3374625 RepID=UPI0037ADF8DD
MTSVYDLKPRFQALLRPLTRGLVARGVTANQVTIAAMLASVATAIALWGLAGDRASLLLLPLLLFVRMALNAIDGMIAREHDQKSQLGAILNEVGDVVSDSALYLALVPALAPYGAHAFPIVLFVIAAILTEFVGVLVQSLGAGRRYDGPMGKSDRAAVVGLAAFLIAIGVPAGWWLDGIMLLLAFLAIWTCFNRARHALRAEA